MTEIQNIKKYKEEANRGKRNMQILAMLMSVAFVVALVWGYWQYNQKQSMAASLENEYQRSFYSLLESTDNLSLLSSKALVSAAPGQSSSLLWQIQSESKNALAYLSSLPLDQQALSRTAAYFNQVADYSNSLVKSLSRGEKISQQQYQQLSEIRKQMDDMRRFLGEAEKAVGQGQLVFTQRTAALKNGGKAVAVNAGSGSQGGVNDYFISLNSKLQSVPMMEYKGVYAGSKQQIKASGLSQKADTTNQEAGKIAADFASKIALDAKYQLNQEKQLSSGGILPAYVFEFAPDNQDLENADKAKNVQDNILISVSKAGGKIVSVYNSRLPQTKQLTTAKALARGDEVVRAAGFKDMKAVSRHVEGNCLLINYNPVKDDIVYYPDLVQVSVALDNGDIISFQAKEYWLNNKERTLADPQILAEDAQKSLHQSFAVEKNQLALIGDGAGGEVLAHEFSGSIGDDNYLVYINGDEGDEENILRRFGDGDDFFTR
ncbi:MAG: germination protein YpeB [Clostridiales bacterium]